MQMEFFGACQTVTGSKHMLTVQGKRILLDCGLFQGRRAETEHSNRHFEFDPRSIDAVIISHAHIDHCGNLPNLVKQGFRGPIYCTHATADLMRPLLLDSARIQQHDVEYLKRKLKFSAVPLQPLYTVSDAETVFKLLRPRLYHEQFTLTDEVSATLFDAGHILGSALIRLTITEGESTLSLGYTGDLGRKFLPVLRDPENFGQVDYLLCESTYGDRLHTDFTTAYAEFAQMIHLTLARGGRVIIPSFALGRAQEILYLIHRLIDEHKIPRLSVYLDSPLAIKFVDIFSRHIDLYDDETKKLFLNQHDNPFTFHGLHLVESTDESKRLNHSRQPCVIIAADGMCEFGRIRHHLKNNLGDEKNTLAIVNYMAQHTLGRKILDGERQVRILDEEIKIRADVKVFNSLSAHADQTGLLEFIRLSQASKTYLVHGEKRAMDNLASLANSRGNREIIVPELGTVYALS